MGTTDNPPFEYAGSLRVFEIGWMYAGHAETMHVVAPDESRALSVWHSEGHDGCDADDGTVRVRHCEPSEWLSVEYSAGDVPEYLIDAQEDPGRKSRRRSPALCGLGA